MIFWQRILDRSLLFVLGNDISVISNSQARFLGPIIQYYGWNMTYYSLMPVAGALLVIVVRLTNKVERNDKGKEQLIAAAATPNSYYKPSTTVRMIKRIATLVDVKGALLLAVSVTSFLLLLTSFENGTNTNDNSSSGSTITASMSTVTQLPLYLATGVISLLFFVFVERRNNYSPLVDLRLLAGKSILISNLLGLVC